MTKTKTKTKTKARTKRPAPAERQALTPAAGVREGHTLMLRTCDKDMKAHGGFTWPREGDVAAPDWDPAKRCGGGLHGLLRGVGEGRLLSWEETSIWLVVEVETAKIVNLDGKVKAPSGRVLYAGNRGGALALMGQLGHLDDGHVGGTATAGDGGTATAGDGGTATAGDRGTIIIKWWDEAARRYRCSLGEVGEAGIVAGGKYQLDASGAFVQVEQPAVPATEATP